MAKEGSSIEVELSEEGEGRRRGGLKEAALSDFKEAEGAGAMCRAVTEGAEAEGAGAACLAEAEGTEVAEGGRGWVTSRSGERLPKRW